MLLKNFLISCALILALISCTKPEKEVVVQTEYIQRTIPLQTRPKPVQLTDVEWYVVTEENIDEFLEKFRQENGTVAFMAVSVRGYESMALNVQELRRFINQQKQIIIYYETMASEPQTTAQ